MFKRTEQKNGQSRYDAALREGACNAIRVCLKVQAGEAVTLIADREARGIAAALADQLSQVGAEYQFLLLDDLAERPLKHMPELILEALRKSQVSIFAAGAQRGELRSRMEMMQVVNRFKLRHGHMVNITPQIMKQGMRADFRRIDDLSKKLIAKVRKARTIRGESVGGTSIVAEFSPAFNWVKTSGIIGSDKWGNLPGGEIFTSPARVDGVFVVDGVVGDYLCSKYGDLEETPLTIQIEDSRIVGLECENLELLEEFRTYTSVDENSNRVGEFAIGTNLSVRDVIGNILQDEKIPGIHVAFGHPYCEHTGQTWVSSTHIDCVGRRFDIWVDDEQIMQQGEFLLG